MSKSKIPYEKKAEIVRDYPAARLRQTWILEK